MASTDIDNGNLLDVPVSFETLPDGAKAQRVISIQADDTPVALTAAQARWAVSTTTIALATKLSGVSGIDYVLLSALVADLTYWFDGKDPAVTAGDILTAGYSIKLAGAAMVSNFKVVRATTVDGVAIVHAFKKPAT